MNELEYKKYIDFLQETALNSYPTFKLIIKNHNLKEIMFLAKVFTVIKKSPILIQTIMNEINKRISKVLNIDTMFICKNYNIFSEFFFESAQKQRLGINIRTSYCRSFISDLVHRNLKFKYVSSRDIDDIYELITYAIGPGAETDESHRTRVEDGYDYYVPDKYDDYFDNTNEPNDSYQRDLYGLIETQHTHDQRELSDLVSLERATLKLAAADSHYNLLKSLRDSCRQIQIMYPDERAYGDDEKFFALLHLFARNLEKTPPELTIDGTQELSVYNFTNTEDLSKSLYLYNLKILISHICGDIVKKIKNLRVQRRKDRANFEHNVLIYYEDYRRLPNTVTCVHYSIHNISLYVPFENLNLIFDYYQDLQKKLKNLYARQKKMLELADSLSDYDFRLTEFIVEPKVYIDVMRPDESIRKFETVLKYFD